MLVLLKIVIGISLVFFALGIACAVKLAWRREGGVGVHGFKHPRHVDPFDHDPFDHSYGDVPGFSRQQIERFEEASAERSRRDALNRLLDFPPSATALRRGTAGSGHSERPSGMSAARNSFGLRGPR